MNTPNLTVAFFFHAVLHHYSVFGLLLLLLPLQYRETIKCINIFFSYSHSTLSHISQLQKTAIKATTRYHPWMYCGTLVIRRDCCCGFTPVSRSARAKFLLLAQLAGDSHHHLIHDAGLCCNHSYSIRGMQYFFKYII